MKNTLLLVFSAVVVSACASPVSRDQALAAARSWVAEGHAIDASRSRVTDVVPVMDGDRVILYRAVREDGSELILSSDEGIDPVIAFYPKRRNNPGSARDVVLDGARRYASESLSRMTNSSAPLKATGPSRWSELLGGRRVRSLKASSSGSPSAYVIDGFSHSGGWSGRYTHWNQTVNPDAVQVGWFSLYDYYMFSETFGGPSGGLPIRIPASKSLGGRFTPPCGCVATAWAAAFQCIGVINSALRHIEVTGPFLAYFDPRTMSQSEWSYVDWDPVPDVVSTVPGTYDWDSLPGNLGGLQPDRAVTEGDTRTRELIGRVTYNCGVACHMEYGRSSSVAFPELMLQDGFGGSNPVFPGMSRGLKVSGSFNGPVEAGFVRSGRPVVFSMPMSILRPGDDDSHCALLVGHDSDTDSFFIFTGWGGYGDAWVSKTALASRTRSILYGAYENIPIPVYGRVVNLAGRPVPDTVVTIRGDGELLKAVKTDSDGYFRCFYSAPSTVPTVSPAGGITITETIGVSGQSFDASRVVVGSSTLSPTVEHNVDRFLHADRGTITVDESFPLPPAIDVVSSDGSVSNAVFVASELSLPLLVIGGDSATNSVVALDYLRSTAGSIAKDRFFVCYTLSGGLASGEYIVFDPREMPSANPYRRGPHVIGYGASCSTLDVAETLRKSLSAYRFGM